jgi:hypothetical protein
VWLPRAGSALRHLLHDGETLLRQLLRRRQKASGVSRAALGCVAASFDSATWRVRVTAEQREALAVMLCAMYWRGCRHPAALGCASLHPPTGLVRWVSRFTVCQQVDHGRQILNMLVAEERRVHAFARQLVGRLVPGSAKSGRAVALLPEMLCADGPQ